MNKRGVLVFSISLVLISLVLISLTSATNCAITAKLLNQDPYPATPGDYVKLVFQVDGISDPSCGTITFELKDKFPISFDPGQSSSYTAESGAYQLRYGSFLTIPFKVKVSPDAVHGDNQIETALSSSGALNTLYNFTLSIEDLRSSFDVYVKNYDTATNILTLEILNIGKSNVKAITLTVPAQEGIVVKGPNKNVVGDLDSNEYTTADFELSGSGKINVQIEYTDEVNVRRTTSKTVEFDPTYFVGRKADQKTTSVWTYLLVLAILATAGYLIYKRYKKNKHK